MRVAVIGAGASGLVTAKSLLEEGIEPVVFERRLEPGGIWAFQEAPGGVFESTRIKISKDFMVFSDFPIAADAPTFPHHRDVKRYFDDYVQAFGLLRHIRLGVEVDRVEPNGDGTWKVTSRRGTHVSVETFDAVAACSGHHSEPLVPTFDGAERFQGAILHSVTYKRADALAGKRVVVVGVGNSGVDVATEVAAVAKSVILSTRRGAHLMPRYLLGRPTDHFFSRFSASLPPWFIDGMIRLILWLLYGSLKRYNLRPRHGYTRTHPSSSDELVGLIKSGVVRVKPNVKCLSAGEVSFEDGSVEPTDVIIYCTGYRIRYPYLAGVLPDFRGNAIGLYKRVFHPDLPGLAFIGLIQPIGALMPIAEGQARWLAQLLRGADRLPDAQEMRREIARYEAELGRRYVASDRHTIQVDMVKYLDEICARFGARPRWWRHLGILPWLLLGPAIPAQWRLEGPGRWPHAAAVVRRRSQAARFRAAAPADDAAAAPLTREQRVATGGPSSGAAGRRASSD